MNMAYCQYLWMLNLNTSYKFYLIVLYLWGVINSPLGIAPLAIGPMKNKEGPIDERCPLKSPYHTKELRLAQSHSSRRISSEIDLPRRTCSRYMQGTTMLGDAPQTSTLFKIWH